MFGTQRSQKSHSWKTVFVWLVLFSELTQFEKKTFLFNISMHFRTFNNNFAYNYYIKSHHTHFMYKSAFMRYVYKF